MHTMVAGKPRGVQEAGNPMVMDDEESKGLGVSEWEASMSTSMRLLFVPANRESLSTAPMWI